MKTPIYRAIFKAYNNARKIAHGPCVGIIAPAAQGQAAPQLKPDSDSVLSDALEVLAASYNATQGHPDADALGLALAACDALPRAGGLMVRPRPYLCRVCGFVENFSTNHTGTHYSPCASCSWRGGRDDSGRYYSAQDKGRPHVYSGVNPMGQGEENPHARPQVEAQVEAQAEALPRLVLPSPYVLEAFARLDAEWGLALVYLPQNVATPWASYRVTLVTGICFAGDYLPPYDNARALALRAFAERLGDALGARFTAWA